MNNIIEKIRENKKTLNDLLQNPDNQTVLNKWLNVELAYTSNAIEGNTLTRRETMLAIEENITSGTKAVTHYIEALNHAKAYEFIIQKSQNSDPIDENMILEIHKIILSGIDNANAGSYRSVRVRISASRTILPNPMKVPDLMEDFCSWLLNSEDVPAIKAIEAHYRLVSIHPFCDGNGRTARLLMNLILLRERYAPIIIRPIDRKRYLVSLESRQVEGNLELYQNFMLTALNRSLKTLIRMLDTSNEETPQKSLLTISKFAKLKGVATSTIRYWVQIGKLEPASYTDSGYMLFDPSQRIKD